MSLEICVLGSGSAGNATIVRTPRGVVMIDAGLGPRTIAKRMVGTGVTVGEIKAMCLTHLDHDHFSRTWYQTVLKQRIRVYVHEDVVGEVLECAEAQAAAADEKLRRLGVPRLEELVQTFDGACFEPVEGLEFEPFPLAHDEEGSHGFVVKSGAVRMGFATDLGRVTEDLLERFCGVDILAIESNYDPGMERRSARPWYLKQRIMGGAGHLSNEEAFAAVQVILDLCQRRHGEHKLPRHIVLLHRSRECNCPDLLRKLFAKDRRIAPVLTLAHQYERTSWLACRGHDPLVGEQLALAWG